MKLTTDRLAHSANSKAYVILMPFLANLYVVYMFLCIFINFMTFLMLIIIIIFKYCMFSIHAKILKCFNMNNYLNKFNTSVFIFR